MIVFRWMFPSRDSPSDNTRDEGERDIDHQSHYPRQGGRTETTRRRQHEAKDGRGQSRGRQRYDDNPPSPNGPREHGKTRHFVRIANENRHLLRNLMSTDHPGIRLRESHKNARCYVRLPPPPRHMDGRLPPSTQIRVEACDSLDAADKLRAWGVDGSDIVVLNMANEQTPGGWYLSGAGAQEEALCRRSSLYLTITPERRFYPILQPGAIFSPDVLVMRKSDELDCAPLPLDEMWWTSVISVAALFRPELDNSGTDFARSEDREEMRERIKVLFRVVALEGKTNLVLSALGCGAFRNPPSAVARLFKEVLQDDEFCGRFQQIWFAILDRKGSGNFDIFRQELHDLAV